MYKLLKAIWIAQPRFVRRLLIPVAARLSIHRHRSADKARIRKGFSIDLYNEMLAVLDEQSKGWAKYDYGGYFYQRWAKIGLSGGETVEDRMVEYNLETSLNKNQSVLDIGANCCFFSLNMAHLVGHVTALEHNPYMIRIGEIAARHLDIKNVSFVNEGFENFQGKFDLICAYASHHTDDGGTVISPKEYMTKIHSMLNEGGQVSFLSHAAETYSQEYEYLKAHMETMFSIEMSKIIKGAMADREYLLLRKL